jgi:catechol 2,3-dioxygenase-like lactoylglutathione lyase family enzyme
MFTKSSRRRFVTTLLAAVGTGPSVAAQTRTAVEGRVRGFDHVAVPMLNTEQMLAFYRKLGFDMTETANAVSVYVGDQMINFHRPALWQNERFTLKAPAARPPCGDFCFVWEGTPASLKAMIERLGVPVVEGPVDRSGGRRKTGSSTYVRDPDGNLLEFIVYA